MTIDITPLAGSDTGAAIDFSKREAKPKLADLPKLHDLVVEGTIGQLGDRYLVKGTLTGTTALECGRCLRNFDYEFSNAFSEEFAPEPSEEQFKADPHQLTLDPMLRTVILTHLPEPPLHDPECKGLCPVCGKDLNDEPHTHAEQPPAAKPNPFAKLDQLKKRR